MRLVGLVLGLVAAAILLAPWKLKLAIDAPELYDKRYERTAREAPADTLGWLAEAGYGYQALRKKNAAQVRRMSQLSGALGVLMVVQTLAWLAALGGTPGRWPPSLYRRTRSKRPRRRLALRRGEADPRLTRPPDRVRASSAWFARSQVSPTNRSARSQAGPLSPARPGKTRLRLRPSPLCD